MICQLNVLRGCKKRTRPDFEKMNMEFDEDSFQFKKIKNEEILFKMKPDFEDIRKAEDGSDHYLIINASPIEYGHVLLAALHNGMGNFAYPTEIPSHPTVKWDGMGTGKVISKKKSHHRFFVKILYILRFVTPKITTHSCVLYVFLTSVGTLYAINGTRYTSGRQKIYC